MKIVSTFLLVAMLQFAPAYVREGDRVEQEFRNHRDRLTRYFEDLRGTVEKEFSPAEASTLLSHLESPPPPVGIYGYQMLPRIVQIPQPPTPIRSFAYSWPITEGYIRAEATKLDRARGDLARVAVVTRDEKLSLLTGLADQYREFVKNQKTVDQYIEYNRFWQRSISESRRRFDRMTEIYWMLKSGNPDTASTIRDVLGKPSAPRYIRIRRQSANRVILQVRLYTDIADDSYLAEVRRAIEERWHAEDNGTRYAIEVDLRKVSTHDLYRGKDVPLPGDHIDVDRHISRFPADGGVLTTGAEFTYGSVGRYVALGPGDLDPRTLAHEFGHIIGFDDGYIRGYNDLGEQGFEILELTAFFDDIMSAPREGHVQPAHFKLLMDALER